MSPSPVSVALPSRAVVSVTGPDWRSFLQGILTNDVEALGVGEARFAGLLTPQGRLLYDLLVVAREDGALLDVEAEHRNALIQRLTMYRLRAKVEISASPLPVSVYFYSAHPRESGDPDISSGVRSEQNWIPAFAGMSGDHVRDPRLPELGLRGYGVPAAESETLYDAHRLALGVPGPADWGSDRTYPIEANFDLLRGIDFKKGCFVGQETTSRMHRRGTVKTRMAPITFEGAPPPYGTELLTAENHRAGEVLSGIDGRAMASLRLDRIEGPLTAEGRAVTVDMPDWLAV